MFKRTLNMFNRSAVAMESDGGGNSNGGVGSSLLPPSHPAAVADENDLENPLLQTTNDAPETPMLSTLRHSGGCSAAKLLNDRRCDWLIPALVFLLIFGIAVYYFVAEVNQIYNNPGFKLNSVVVSSFNVSKTSPETTWDTALSLDLLEGNFRKLDLRYEVPRLWVYFGDEGFVSMTSPSMEYSRDGKKLILRAVFGVEEDIKHQVVNLDMVMESNAVHNIKIHSSEVEIKSFLMISCEGLMIEFDPLTKRFGTLIESGKSCRVQVCPIEPHPLYDGLDECTSS